MVRSFHKLMPNLIPAGDSESHAGAQDPVSCCYVFTIKKSGSHLIRNVLRELGLTCIDCLRPGSSSRIQPPDAPVAPRGFVLSLERPSLPWRGSCQQGRGKIIFNLRDPRAVFLSLLDFYDWNVPLASPGLHTVEFRRAACRAAFRDREQLGMALIHDEQLDDDPFTPWLNFRRSRALYHNPNAFKVRFEKLAAGVNENSATGDHPVIKICEYLGIACPSDPGDVVRRAIDAESITKNVGDSERWRTGLSRPLLETFMAKHGDIVREYGYAEH